MTTKETTEGFSGWAIVEVFGHRKLGGFVQSSPPEMPGLIRVDVVPEGDVPIATQYYGPASIFCLTPCTEDLARRLAAATVVRPVAQYELPPPPPPRRPEAYSSDDDDVIDPSFHSSFDDEDDRED